MQADYMLHLNVQLQLCYSWHCYGVWAAGYYDLINIVIMHARIKSH